MYHLSWLLFGCMLFWWMLFCWLLFCSINKKESRWYLLIIIKNYMRKYSRWLSKLLENSKLALVCCSDELRGWVSNDSPNSERCTSTSPFHSLELTGNFLVTVNYENGCVWAQIGTTPTVTRKLQVNSNGRMERLMCNFPLMGYYCSPNLSIHQNST